MLLGFAWGETVGKKTLNRRTAEEAISFLDDHMLDPTPSNYTFAYLYVTGANGWLRKAVDSFIDGGIRLAQKDVDELMDMAPGEANSGHQNSMAALDAQQAHLRHQILNFETLTASALNETGHFNRDLTANAERMQPHVELGEIIHAMIKRTAQMEQKLADTRQETERLRQDLDAARDDASRDALTDLPNRRAIDRQLQSIGEDDKTLAIAFCDIDNFKSINDRFGHAVGDRVLKVVAETLSETMRPHVVGRFGGEEFVVVLEDTDGDTAFQLVEQARRAVSARNFRVRDTDELIGQITFSAGIAETCDDPDEALRLADQLLYEAKRLGRNRTVYRSAV